MPGDDWYDEEPRIAFSGTEVIHLLASIVVLTIAFAVAMGQMSFLRVLPDSQGLDLGLLLQIAPFSALIVITSFMLHELAHKVAAQMRDMWAEFRASGSGLLVALAASLGTGFVLAAPGAVMIYGYATDRDSGVISIVGPMVNLVLGFAALPFVLYSDGIPIYRGGPDLFVMVVFVNAFLAAFNMLPIMPLDGSKVWRWSKLAYIGTVLLVLALFMGLFLGESAF